MRVGIFTGEAVAGSLGSARRMKHTTVGDAVNTATRLESFRNEGFESELESGAPVDTSEEPDVLRLIRDERVHLIFGRIMAQEPEAAAEPAEEAPAPDPTT